MRISDWSSDVCSSDLAIVAQASAIESGAANAKLDFVALARDVNIARIDIVAAGVVVGRLLTAEPAGILEFPSHGPSPSFRPPPCRRLHATNRDRKSTRRNSRH